MTSINLERGGGNDHVSDKGSFTTCVYNARWVGDKKSGTFVNVYSINFVNEGRWLVKNMRKFVNVNCERPLWN